MITNISVRNFKVFKDFEFRPSNLTILAGMNGMGKSSVIQTLLLLRQSFDDTRLMAGALSLNGSLVNLGKGKDVLYQYAIDETIAIGLSVDQVSYQWEFEYRPERDYLSGKDENQREAFEHINLFGDKFQYLHAERQGPEDIYAMNDFVVANQRQVGIHGELTAHYLYLFRNEEVTIPALHHAHAKTSTLYHQVEAWLGEISPGIRVNVTNLPGTNSVILTYQYSTGNDYTDNFRPTNVGFGISYCLPIIVSILSAKPGKLIIIENPEAHLHPRGQSAMGKLMALAAQSGIQIIVETHSDHVVNGVRVATKQRDISPEHIRIYFFDRVISDNEHKTRIRSPVIDAEGRIDFFPEGFFDEWDHNLLELL